MVLSPSTTISSARSKQVSGRSYSSLWLVDFATPVKLTEETMKEDEEGGASMKVSLERIEVCLLDGYKRRLSVRTPLDEVKQICVLILSIQRENLLSRSTWTRLVVDHRSREGRNEPCRFGLPTAPHYETTLILNLNLQKSYFECIGSLICPLKEMVYPTTTLKVLGRRPGRSSLHYSAPGPPSPSELIRFFVSCSISRTNNSALACGR
jgi:hypothetical protein